MHAQEVNLLIKNYLKENLTISIEMDSEPEGYCSSRSINVKVKLFLGKEQIDEANDYATIPDKY